MTWEQMNRELGAALAADFVDDLIREADVVELLLKGSLPKVRFVEPEDVTDTPTVVESTK